MPLLLVGLAAVFGAGGFLVDRASTAGLTPLNSQANTPAAAGTIGGSVDKFSTAASVGLLLVSGAFAYSLVKR